MRARQLSYVHHSGQVVALELVMRAALPAASRVAVNYELTNLPLHLDNRRKTSPE
jgi:hypothetical protein